MLLENPGADRGRYGMLNRLKGLAVAFLVMITLTFTLVGFFSGMLLMMESFDDTRAAGLDAWNADVADWNSYSRSNFEKIGPSITVNDHPLTASTEDIIYDLLKANDASPEELLKPKALFYKKTQDISGLKPIPGSTIEVDVGTAAKSKKLAVPLVFEEVRCRYVQRGKMSREVCEPHFFALQGICVKVDGAGQPSDALDGVTGASTGVGCFLGTEGMFHPRVTNIWSPGLYIEYSQEYELKLPASIDIAVHSNTDPALTASIYTGGYYTFGQGPEDKFSSGLWIFTLSTLMLCGFITMCTLQYIWPTAPSYGDRFKYFYRRYLRHHHAAFNRWWARTCGTAEEPMPEIPMNEQLLEEQAMREEGDDWTGPRDGGHRLGGSMPPLVQSV